MSASLAIALRSLLAHKLRSLLTMLGIVIGIAAVITVVAVGRGAERQVADQLRTLGANLLLVSPGARQRDGVRLSTGTALSLTQDDAEAIQSAIPAVASAGVYVSGRAQAVAAKKNWSTLVAGVSPEYLTARNWTVARGARFDPSDIERAAKVILLGSTVARELFGGADPIGQLVRIRNTPFVVIGVLATKGRMPKGAIRTT